MEVVEGLVSADSYPNSEQKISQKLSFYLTGQANSSAVGIGGMKSNLHIAGPCCEPGKLDAIDIATVEISDLEGKQTGG